jgi:hypothetical protein
LVPCARKKSPRKIAIYCGARRRRRRRRRRGTNTQYYSGFIVLRGGFERRAAVLPNVIVPRCREDKSLSPAHLLAHAGRDSTQQKPRCFLHTT